MSELTKEQQLESAVTVLKARLFDVQEQAAQLHAENKEITGALSQIAIKVGLQGEAVTLTSIVEAVEALLPEQEELDLDPTE